MSGKDEKIFTVILLLSSIMLGVLLGLAIYKYAVIDRSFLPENDTATYAQKEPELSFSEEHDEVDIQDKDGWIAFASGDIAPPPVPEIDPVEVRGSDEYVTGMQDAVKAFYDQWTSKYPDVEADLVRYTLRDIDKDGIEDLIMHDVTGECAYISVYYNKKILDPIKIFDNQDIEKSEVQNYGAYAAIYDDTDVITVYEFTNNYDESGYGTVKQVVVPKHEYKQEITTSFLRINKIKGSMEEISRVKAIRNYSDGEYEFSFRNGNGSTISEADYRECFKENIGEDNYKRFFMDEIMIADSEYSFRSEYLWNSRPSEEHLTKEQILLRLKP